MRTSEASELGEERYFMAKDMDEIIKDDAEKIVGYGTTKPEKPVKIEYAKDLYELRVIQMATRYNYVATQYSYEATSTIISRQFGFNRQELEEMAAVINQSALGLRAEVVEVGVWSEISEIRG